MPKYRQGAGRGSDGKRTALLRDGAGEWSACDQVLRRTASDPQGTPETVRSHLPGRWKWTSSNDGIRSSIKLPTVTPESYVSYVSGI